MAVVDLYFDFGCCSCLVKGCLLWFGLGLVLCLWVCLLPGCCLMTVGSLVVFAVGLVLCWFKLIVLGLVL